VVPVTQNAAGGVLQVVVVDVYEHEPPLQVPGEEYVRRAVPLAQSGAGGVVQFTPLHGSPMQALFEQPNWHVTSFGA
jgi:hypothetical protein